MFYTTRPISDRTEFRGPDWRKRATFKAAWSDTLELLEREIGMLAGLGRVVIECDVREQDIRLDGAIRANAQPASPAVRVAFESVDGPMQFATDRFTDWRDNVRAIALGLEALRKVERYGIADSNQQYTGFRAIGTGDTGAREAAAHVLERVAIGASDHDVAPIIERIRTDGEYAREIHREARRIAHPDANDGDRTLWETVENAARALGLQGTNGAREMGS